METFSSDTCNPSTKPQHPAHAPLPQAGGQLMQLSKQIVICCLSITSAHADMCSCVIILLNSWLEIFLLGCLFLSMKNSIWQNCFAIYCTIVETNTAYKWFWHCSLKQNQKEHCNFITNQPIFRTCSIMSILKKQLTTKQSEAACRQDFFSYFSPGEL